MGTFPLARYKALVSLVLITGLTLGFLFFIAFSSSALSPSSVVVLANPDFAGSVEVAEYYMEARDIPEANLLAVAGPTSEIISRAQYNEYEADVEQALEAADLADSVEVLVLVYGVPLKVNSDDTWNYNGNQSSVDGELALLVSDTMTSGNDGRYLNPYFNTWEPFASSENDDMLLVARLDGHDADEAKALVDEAMAAEVNNTQGWAYFDRDTGMGGNYASYDEMIVEAFNISLERGLSSALENTANDIGYSGAQWDERSTNGTEPANGTVNPFFYWGWYADSAYHDTFNWTPGAAGMRLHSFNARSMRDSTWVTGAVADDIAGSTGHVWEPWLDAAAYPHFVMKAFYDGYTAAEAFWMGTPYLSWQNIVVGDPLYTPVQLDFSLELVSDLPAVPVHPGDDLTLELTLTNHNTIHQEFEIAVEGLPWGFNATPSPTRIQVNGSDGFAEVTVEVELDPDPTLVQAGPYVLKVIARSVGGSAVNDTLSVNLTVGQGAALGLDTLLDGSAAPGENATLALLLSNLGNADDDLTLGLTLPPRLQAGAMEWLEESGTRWYEQDTAYLTLPMGFRDSITLLFNISLPLDMSLWAGTLFNLTVNGRSGFNDSVTEHIQLILEVEPYYGLALDPPADLQRLMAGSSAPVNFTLNNTGNAPYEVTVTAYSGGELDWLDGSASSTLELDPQENRTVNLTLRVRPEAQAGPQNMSWDLTWQGPPAAGEIVLIVQRVDVWLEQVKLLNLGYSNDPRPQDPMTLKGSVNSNGLPIEGNLTLSLTGIDWRTRTIEIEPRKLPYQFSYNFTLNAGGSNLSLDLEAPEGLFELSDSNNLAWREVEVLPVPDLRVTTFSVTPGLPGSGEAMVNLTFTTVPSGWSDGDPVELFTLKPSGMALLSLDGEVIQQYWIQRTHQEHTYNLTGVPGKHNVTLTIDPDGLWTETDDNNNDATVEFVVQKKDDEAASIPLTVWIAGLVMIGVIVAAILALKLKKPANGSGE